MKILLFYSLQLFSDAVWGRGLLFVYLNCTTSTIAYDSGSQRGVCGPQGIREPNVGGSANRMSGVCDRSVEYQGPLDFSSKKSRIIKFSLRI